MRSRPPSTPPSHRSCSFPAPPPPPCATTKRVGEFACQEVSQLKGLDTVVLRIFNAYGPRQDPTSAYAGAIARFCNAIAGEKPIEIHGDGEQTRDFLYAADVAEAPRLPGGEAAAGPTIKAGPGSAGTRE